MSQLKQIILIRKDLKMTKGKIAAQAAHASLNAVINFNDTVLGHFPTAKILGHKAIEWLAEGQTKVCLAVNSEKELLEFWELAKTLDIPNAIIQDAGHTQLDPATYTALAIGPEYNSLIDKITADLKLL